MNVQTVVGNCTVEELPALARECLVCLTDEALLELLCDLELVGPDLREELLARWTDPAPGEEGL